MTSFSPRQKGFVHETGCFNVHISNEAIKAAKQSKELVAIQLHVVKVFDTVHHDAIEAAVERQGLPKGAREFIMNMYRGLTTTIEDAGSKTEDPQQCLNKGPPQTLHH